MPNFQFGDLPSLTTFGSAAQLASFRASLAALSAAAAGFTAPELDAECRKVIGAGTGEHPAAVTSLWAAQALAAAGNAAGARTAIATAVTVAAGLPTAMQIPGVML